jgi:hypothetical protein
MDYSPIINEVFKLWWVIPILLVIAVFKSPWFKGLLGETLVKTCCETEASGRNLLPTP